MPLYLESVKTPPQYNNILIFVKACLIEDNAGYVAASELYQRYFDWCNSVDACTIHSMTVFGRILSSYGVQRINRGGIHRIGISLLDVPLEPGEDVLNEYVRRPSYEAFSMAKGKG